MPASAAHSAALPGRCAGRWCCGRAPRSPPGWRLDDNDAPRPGGITVVDRGDQPGRGEQPPPLVQRAASDVGNRHLTRPRARRAVTTAARRRRRNLRARRRNRSTSSSPSTLPAPCWSQRAVLAIITHLLDAWLLVGGPQGADGPVGQGLDRARRAAHQRGDLADGRPGSGGMVGDDTPAGPARPPHPNRCARQVVVPTAPAAFHGRWPRVADIGVSTRSHRHSVARWEPAPRHDHVAR
jgi:hypothetical protein